MEQAKPPDPETARSRCTGEPVAQKSARAARDTLSHSSLRCSVCLRDFPWLHNETDARCRTCDAFAEHVRRSMHEREQTAPAPLLPGERVRLHSLVRADLNGRLGKLLVFVPEKERWAVKVDGPGGGCRILLKGENLECVPSMRKGPPRLRKLERDSDSECESCDLWESESDSDF